MPDTIFALSSGPPPAGIAIVRVSGPDAGAALTALFGRLPEARRASAGALADPATGDLLDHALVLWFPGPATATGEDLAELHLHGGRAVVAGVQEALRSLPALRPAEPGEFTRRAFENGRIDLSEAEGLADLLAAETKSQRRAALLMLSGEVSRRVSEWRGRLLQLSAQLETLLDFSDEGDVIDELPQAWHVELSRIREEIEAILRRPRTERLKDGVRVAISGPPNAGKSTLLNALVQRDAAITSDMPGTTRDVIEVPVSIAGIPFVFLDTAGIRSTEEQIEKLGISRALQAIEIADLILWLGSPDDQPQHPDIIQVVAKCDLPGRHESIGVPVSALTGAGMNKLFEELTSAARGLLPAEGEVAINARHAEILQAVALSLYRAADEADLLIKAENLRLSRVHFDLLTGKAGVEDMLDSLFGSFCIGK